MLEFPTFFSLFNDSTHKLKIKMKKYLIKFLKSNIISFVTLGLGLVVLLVTWYLFPAYQTIVKNIVLAVFAIVLGLRFFGLIYFAVKNWTKDKNR